MGPAPPTTLLGCINGGGQVRGAAPAEQEQLLALCRSAYAQAESADLLAAEADAVAAEWARLNPDWRALLFASLQEVRPNAPNSLAAMAW